MALYDGGINSVWGPVGKVEVYFQYDDMGTPQTDPENYDPVLDDVMKNVVWRNPNPLDASLAVTFRTSGRKQIFALTHDTPDWVFWPVPQNYQARRGQLNVSGPNYPATPEVADGR